nr:hypothetical protein [Dyadobacter sp. CY261]
MPSYISLPFHHPCYPTGHDQVYVGLFGVAAAGRVVGDHDGAGGFQVFEILNFPGITGNGAT